MAIAMLDLGYNDGMKMITGSEGIDHELMKSADGKAWGRRTCKI